MARSKHDQATVAWTTATANDLQSRFESTWWDAAAGQYADSLMSDGKTQVFQKHWIGQTPMESQLFDGSELASGAHGQTALGGRENSTYSGDRPGNLGLFHTGRGSGPGGTEDLEIFSLTTAIQAVGEGNYGRMGAGQQPRYTDANAETMISEPATGNTPDEQPGAMPEIFPSQGFDLGGNINRCWTCRSMFMQAWGNYGTAWSVIHQQLGVRPFLGNGSLEVTPQVPPGEPRIAGRNIRLGNGYIDVRASAGHSRYTTTVDPHLRVRLTVGHTLPAGATIKSVKLNGSKTSYKVRDTNRGREVLVKARGRGEQRLVIRTG
jgi:hypothetical protein